MIDWHIITGEYPPQSGGVSDYTQLVAEGLAQAGDRVQVWVPPCSMPVMNESRVEVHRLPDRFGPRGLAMINKGLNRSPHPFRILVQYVPQAYGWKGFNVPFCLWLGSRHEDHIWVMFHEVYFPLSRNQSVKYNALGIVTRLMAILLARAAERMFVSIPTWKELLTPLTPKRIDITWLPVPSSVPVIVDPIGTKAIRERYAPEGGGSIIGHFGTYGKKISDLLKSLIPPLLLDYNDQTMLLLGRGGTTFRNELIHQYPNLARKVQATGTLSLVDISRHLSACDVMVQPFVDGVSSRRTSIMAGLTHGLPIVTTKGFLTEPLWAESGAVSLAEAGDTDGMLVMIRHLLTQVTERTRMGKAATSLYLDRFDIKHTIAALRQSVPESEVQAKQ